MKGLIIQDPHAHRIVEGSKKWEMRSRKTNVRGRIAIILAGSGTIIGEADLVGCGGPLKDADEARSAYQYHRVKDIALLDKWRIPWLLENVEKYDEPKPYNHPKGAVTWVNLPD